jgi:hypothetical protein
VSDLARYRQLDEAQLDQTLRRLRDRVAERFPDSGLSQLSAELVVLSDETRAVVAYLRRPRWAIRIAVGAVIAGMSAVVIVAALGMRRISGEVDRLSELAQMLDSATNDIVFLGVAIYFLVTLEGRLKRRKALRSLHQLRSVVHIVDMHQLTKDPERLLSPREDTASSPERPMTAPELGRYLDYCSELLSLTSKLAALFVQHFNDPVVLSTVNEVETLGTGLSGKIWQKITLLERTMPRDAREPRDPASGSPATR